MSRIEQLPAEIKDRLDAMLREGVSQAEILRRLEDPVREAGEEPLSKAGLNRYCTKMAEFDAEFREISAIAEVFNSKYGEMPLGDVSRLTVQILGTTVFRVAERVRKSVAGGEETIDIKEINQLALAVKRLEQSQEVAIKREKDLREAHKRQKEALAKLEAAEKDAGGDAREALRRLREEVYGIFESDG